MFERADCLSGTGFLGVGDSLSDSPLFGERIFARKDCFFADGCFETFDVFGIEPTGFFDELVSFFGEACRSFISSSPSLGFVGRGFMWSLVLRTTPSGVWIS